MLRSVWWRRAKSALVLAATAVLSSSASGQDFEFAKGMGGSGGDQSHTMAAFANGEFATAGYGTGVVTFGRGEANETSLSLGTSLGPWVARFSADGSLQWATTFPHTSAAWVHRASALGDGSMIITGAFYGQITFGAGDPNETQLTAVQNNDVFVARLNSDGSLVFALQASAPRIGPAGMDVMADGSFVITGTYNGNANFSGISVPGRGDWDMFVACYNANGSIRWARGAGGLLNDGGWNVTCLADGTAIVTGYLSGGCVIGAGEPNQVTLTVSTNPDLVLCKFAANGNLMWARQGTGTTPAGWIGIDAFNDGSFVVAGHFQGSIAWGGHSVGGNGDDAFIARFAPDGSLVWINTIGAAGFDRGHDVSITDSGEIVWCGEFSGSVNIGTSLNISSAGGTDVFLIRCTGDGQFVWAQRAGGPQNDVAHAVETLSDGSIFVAGMYSFAAVFGGGSANQTSLSSAGDLDVFVAKWTDPDIGALPPSLVVPANIVKECDEQSMGASVEFPVEIQGTVPAGAELQVRDLTGDRVLHLSAAIAGVTSIGPAVFPMGVSTVEVALVQGGQIVIFSRFDVTVQDTLAPVLSGCDAKTLELEGPLTELTRSRLGITVWDDCDSAPVVTLSPTHVPLGMTQVTATATDASGNVAQCTFPVMIVDTTSPTFLVTQADIDRIVTSSDGAVIGFDVVATDLSGSVMLSCVDQNGRTVLPSGSQYVPGVYTVTCTAVDGSGNSAVDTFEIRVTEDPDPVIQVPDDIVVGNEPGQAYAHVSFSVVVTDDTDGLTVEITAGGGPVQSGDAFPIGATTVTVVATDRAGNVVTASFQIIVQDREAPTMTFTGQYQFDSIDGTITLTPQLVGLLVEDNYDPNPTVVFSPSTVGLGTTSVTVTATDADGNAAVAGFVVTITKKGVNLKDSPTNIPDWVRTGRR